LPELYKIDLERNEIIEKSILTINKQGIMFKEEDFFKKLEIPKMPGNLRKENYDQSLLSQSFFKLNNHGNEENGDGKNIHKRTKSLGDFNTFKSSMYLEEQEMKVLNKSLETEEESSRKKLFTLTDPDLPNEDLDNEAYEI
jgi:hypothetical protein